MEQREDIIWNGGELLLIKHLNSVVTDTSEGSVTSLHCNFSDLFNHSLKKARIHHLKHVTDTRLQQKSVDIYKVLSWITWHMTDACPDEGSKRIVALAGVDALNEALSHEKSGLILPEMTLKLLQAFLVNEAKGKTIHGIALNGLFVAFHSASQALKQTQ